MIINPNKAYTSEWILPANYPLNSKIQLDICSTARPYVALIATTKQALISFRSMTRLHSHLGYIDHQHPSPTSLCALEPSRI